jgi:hypothetical protein
VLGIQRGFIQSLISVADGTRPLNAIDRLSGSVTEPVGVQYTRCCGCQRQQADKNVGWRSQRVAQRLPDARKPIEENPA